MGGRVECSNFYDSLEELLGIRIERDLLFPDANDYVKDCFNTIYRCYEELRNLKYYWMLLGVVKSLRRYELTQQDMVVC